jgi:hypothetical protein
MPAHPCVHCCSFAWRLFLFVGRGVLGASTARLNTRLACCLHPFAHCCDASCRDLHGHETFVWSFRIVQLGVQLALHPLKSGLLIRWFAECAILPWDMLSYGLNCKLSLFFLPGCIKLADTNPCRKESVGTCGGYWLCHWARKDSRNGTLRTNSQGPKPKHMGASLGSGKDSRNKDPKPWRLPKGTVSSDPKPLESHTSLQ